MKIAEKITSGILVFILGMGISINDERKMKNEIERTLAQTLPRETYSQDINQDGTNELVVLDRSLRKTVLYRYGNSESNLVYFTLEQIRDIKQRNLERELERSMAGYTNSAGGAR